MVEADRDNRKMLGGGNRDTIDIVITIIVGESLYLMVTALRTGLKRDLPWVV